MQTSARAAEKGGGVRLRASGEEALQAHQGGDDGEDELGLLLAGQVHQNLPRQLRLMSGLYVDTAT